MAAGRSGRAGERGLARESGPGQAGKRATEPPFPPALRQRSGRRGGAAAGGMWAGTELSDTGGAGSGGGAARSSSKERGSRAVLVPVIPQPRPGGLQDPTDNCVGSDAGSQRARGPCAAGHLHAENG